jgi:hypothetical protein
MASVSPLLSFLLMIAAGWVHRHQLIVIEFLQAENRLLKGRLRGKRIRFTDAERALLASKAKAVGRKALLELETIVSPDTLLRWHRRADRREMEFRAPARAGAARDHAEDLRSDCAYGPGQPGLGITPDSRGARQPGPPGRTRDGSQCVEAQRHRAVSGAEQTNDTVDIPDSALEATVSK